MKFTYTLSLQDVVTFNKVACWRLAATTTTAKTRLWLFALNVIAWMAIAYTSAAYSSLYKRPRLAADLNEVLIAFGIAAAVLLASHFYRQRVTREVAFSDTSWLRATRTRTLPKSLSHRNHLACWRFLRCFLANVPREIHAVVRS